MDCLSNLEKCQASCCKSFTFLINAEQVHVFTKGATIKMPIKLTDDMIWYFQLHNCTYVGGFLSFVINDVKVEDEFKRLKEFKVWILNPCSMLDNFKCKIHDNKPNICREMNETTIKLGKYSLTENCILSKTIVE